LNASAFTPLARPDPARTPARAQTSAAGDVGAHEHALMPRHDLVPSHAFVRLDRLSWSVSSRGKVSPTSRYDGLIAQQVRQGCTTSKVTSQAIRYILERQTRNSSKACCATQVLVRVDASRIPSLPGYPNYSCSADKVSTVSFAYIASLILMIAFCTCIASIFRFPKTLSGRKNTVLRVSLASHVFASQHPS
jgi:hypothetical protein